MSKAGKRILIALLCLVLAAVLVVGVYVLYVTLQYSRIADNTPLAITNNREGVLATGQPYTALTYNIGFGAYDPEYSFFMDTGIMKDGTEVTGKHARARSLEAAQRNTAGALDTIKSLSPDFVMLQEVDVDGDRSYHIDQAAEITSALADYASTYASNFHTAYLCYPFNEPIGATESGLVTLSRYQVNAALRRSFPVDNGFPTRFFDLDRCLAVLRIPVEGGGELVLINVHMSAYDEGGIIRAAQMKMLSNLLRDEQDGGNWVIVGGDYNHALSGSETLFPSEQQMPGWLAVLDDSELPDGYSVVRAENIATVATNRGADLPYTPGVNYTVVIDGFIVSDNVRASAQNINAGFLYSDHNPVLVTFTLEP